MPLVTIQNVLIVPDFFRILVKAGASVKSLARVNSQFQQNLERDARGAIADRLQVPRRQLPGSEWLKNQPFRHFTQVLAALEPSGNKRFPPHLYASLRDLFVYSGADQETILEYLRKNERCSPTCFWFTPLPQRTRQIIEFDQARAQIAWPSVGRQRPAAHSWLAEHFMRVAETLKRPGGWFSLFPGTWAGLHVGLCIASLIASAMPSNDSGALFKESIIAVCAILCGIVASVFVFVPDLLGTMIFSRSEINHRHAEKSHFNQAMQDIWPNLTNPYQQSPYNWSDTKAKYRFEFDKRIIIYESTHKRGHGLEVSLADLTKQGFLAPTIHHMGPPIQYPPISDRHLDHFWIMLQFAEFNCQVRPYLLSDRCIQRLEQFSNAGTANFWDNLVAVMAGIHRRNDVFRLPSNPIGA